MMPGGQRNTALQRMGMQRFVSDTNRIEQQTRADVIALLKQIEAGLPRFIDNAWNAMTAALDQRLTPQARDLIVAKICLAYPGTGPHMGRAVSEALHTNLDFVQQMQTAVTQLDLQVLGIQTNNSAALLARVSTLITIMVQKDLLDRCLRQNELPALLDETKRELQQRSTQCTLERNSLLMSHCCPGLVKDLNAMRRMLDGAAILAALSVVFIMMAFGAYMLKGGEPLPPPRAMVYVSGLVAGVIATFKIVVCAQRVLNGHGHFFRPVPIQDRSDEIYQALQAAANTAGIELPNREEIMRAAQQDDQQQLQHRTMDHP